MGFLNQAVLKQKSADAAVGKHPLLQEGAVPQNVRQSYLQGCVLAVLERDNGEISPTARQEISRLGKSLELSDSDMNESISIVTALNSPEDQGQFLEELFSTLSEARYAQYFLSDFENHLKKNGQLSEDAKKILDMFKDALARNSVSSHQDGMNGGSCVDAKQNHPVSAGWTNRPADESKEIPLSRQSTSEVVWRIKEHAFHYEFSGGVGGKNEKIRHVVTVTAPLLRRVKIEVPDYSIMDKQWNESRKNALLWKVRDVVKQMMPDVEVADNGGWLQITLPSALEADRLEDVGNRDFQEAMKYYGGDGVSQDYDKAYEYFGQCLDDTDICCQAMYMMATMRLEGKTRLRDDKKLERKEAAGLLRICADNGLELAISMIRTMEMQAHYVYEVFDDDTILSEISRWSCFVECVSRLTRLDELTLGDEGLLGDLQFLMEDFFCIKISDQEMKCLVTVDDLVRLVRNKKTLV